MLFQIYGDGAGWQLLGWVLVFAGLVLANEFARRTKIGGLICFELFRLYLQCISSQSISVQQMVQNGH